MTWKYKNLLLCFWNKESLIRIRIYTCLKESDPMRYIGEVAIPFLVDYFKTTLIPRFLEIVRVPYDHHEVLWAIAPLVITLFLVQIYFGRHRQEELGWESAYGNSVVLIFVVVDLVRYLIQRYGFYAVIQFGNEAFYKLVIVAVIFFVAISLFFIDFFHSLSKRISFFLSSALFIVFVAYLAIVSIYSDIIFDRHTAITAILFFVALYTFFAFFRWLVPPSPEAELYLEQRHAQHKEWLLHKEKELKDHIQSIKEKIGF